jgi:hypothetical protein
MEEENPLDDLEMIPPDTDLPAEDPSEPIEEEEN